MESKVRVQNGDFEVSGFGMEEGMKRKLPETFLLSVCCFGLDLKYPQNSLCLRLDCQLMDFEEVI